MKTDSSRKARAGYTLIEICTVLAVLLVLAALLFPVFGRVREKGRQKSCQSNLRQIYLGMVQYVADHDSRFPNFGMLEPLMPYVKSYDLFYCPSTPLPPGTLTPNGGSDYSPIGSWIHALSYVPTSSGLPTPKLLGINEAGILEPSKMILIADDAILERFREDVSLPRGKACGITHMDGKPDTIGTYSNLHSGGLNAGFYDGHIKWITPAQAAECECEMGKHSLPPFRAGGPHLTD